MTLILAITGMPGAGKSTAAHALESLGLRKITMGDVVREETRRRGLEPDPGNTGAVMKELRERLGEGAVAEVCLRRVLEMKEAAVIVDGIRSTTEVDVFRREADVKLLAVHASRPRRFQLLKERGRSDDPLDWDTFVARDERELGVGIGGAIALADEIISNENITPEALGERVKELARVWMGALAG